MAISVTNAGPDADTLQRLRPAQAEAAFGDAFDQVMAAREGHARVRSAQIVAGGHALSGNGPRGHESVVETISRHLGAPHGFS